MKNAILGLLGALALLGCGGGGSSSSDSNRPRVAYVNVSPDAGAVDFVLNDNVKGNAVPFGSATAFENIKADDYDVTVQPDGSNESLWSESHGFTTNTDTLAVAVGMRTPFADNSQTPPVVELDKRLVLSFSTIDRTPPVGNRARLFIVHGYVRQQGFGTPSIDFRNPGDTPLVSATGISFGAIRPIDVDSGSQTFQVRQNGTDQLFVNDTAFTLEPGKIYIALISGIEGTTGTTLPKITLVPLATRVP